MRQSKLESRSVWPMLHQGYVMEVKLYKKKLQHGESTLTEKSCGQWGSGDPWVRRAREINGEVFCPEGLVRVHWRRTDIKMAGDDRFRIESARLSLSMVISGERVDIWLADAPSFPTVRSLSMLVRRILQSIIWRHISGRGEYVTVA